MNCLGSLRDRVAQDSDFEKLRQDRDFVKLFLKHMKKGIFRHIWIDFGEEDVFIPVHGRISLFCWAWFSLITLRWTGSLRCKIMKNKTPFGLAEWKLVSNFGKFVEIGLAKRRVNLCKRSLTFILCAVAELDFLSRTHNLLMLSFWNYS